MINLIDKIDKRNKNGMCYVLYWASERIEKSKKPI